MENDFKEWADIVRENKEGKNICFLSRGEWNEPEIAYRGKLFNYYDVYELCDVEGDDDPSVEEWVYALDEVYAIDEELTYLNKNEAEDFCVSDVMNMFELKIINN